MCNLYSMVSNQETIRQLARVMHGNIGTLPSLPGIFPDQLAPVICNAKNGERALELMRWGFPPAAKVGIGPVINVRNANTSFWRAWLKPAYRCLVPATSFCEYTDSPPKVPHWFALDDSRPLFAFAGIWRPWTGARGTQIERRAAAAETGSEERDHLLFSFLTTKANDVVRPIHAKAMPVVLTSDEDYDTWLSAEPEEALKLQRPLPPDRLKIVAKGEREDRGGLAAIPDRQ
jgi:putative SOS response-associated peptidase YedK